MMAVPMNDEKAFLVFLQVEYVQAEPEIYVLPLACALGEKADPVCRDWPPFVWPHIRQTFQPGRGALRCHR